MEINSRNLEISITKYNMELSLLNLAKLIIIASFLLTINKSCNKKHQTKIEHTYPVPYLDSMKIKKV